MNEKRAIEEDRIVDMREITDTRIIDILCKYGDTTIYVLNQNQLFGIITIGNFIRYKNKKGNLVSTSYTSVNDCDNTQEVDEIFSEHTNINCVPVISKQLYLVAEFVRKVEATDIDISENEYINYCRIHNVSEEKSLKTKSLYIYKLCKEAGKDCILIENLVQFVMFDRIINELNQLEIPVYWFNRPSKNLINYYTDDEKNRIKDNISFPFMMDNFHKYRDVLKDIFGTRYSKEFLESLQRVPEIVKKGALYEHVDSRGKYINVIGGKRITTNQPSDSQIDVYMYGRCGVFGYAVEDKDTIPSVLQKKLNDRYTAKTICVHNCGLWGGGGKEIINNMVNTTWKNNSIVILYLDLFSNKELEYFKNKGMFYEDTSHLFNRPHNLGNYFFDRPGHMNADGYQIIAEEIFDKVNFDINIVENNVNTNSIKIDYELYKQVKNEYKKYNVCNTKEKVGSIVMNCNPFTLGHRYLIEMALKYVDLLYIFVVQEDKSTFKFVDRIEMVKRGTRDLKNVVVIPSGQFVLSAITFPGYFSKDSLQEVKVDTSSDIEIFAKYVAPYLNIKYRFVGEEPIDKVTRQYNECMKRILPEYGIECIEMPRITNDNNIISASYVRKMLMEKNNEEIKKYVPQTTYEYLMKELNQDDN